MAPIVEQCEKLRADKASLPPEARCLPGGPASKLIDHPGDYAGVAYGLLTMRRRRIRLEGAFLSYRFKGDNHRGCTPHAGGKSVNPNYSYQYHDGRIYFRDDAGGLGIEWRGEGERGTAFIPGSHRVQLQENAAIVPTIPIRGCGIRMAVRRVLCWFFLRRCAIRLVFGRRMCRGWLCFTPIITSMCAITSPGLQTRCSIHFRQNTVGFSARCITRNLMAMNGKDV